MTTVQTTTLNRAFLYQGMTLGDPGSHLTIEKVKSVLARMFPEISACEFIGPTIKGETAQWEILKAAGTKG